MGTIRAFLPVIHQPDFTSVTIDFLPDKLCIESKSQQLDLWTFHQEAIFAEGLANIITEDI